MSRTQRLGLVAVAALIAIGAFVLLRPAAQEPAERAAGPGASATTTTERAGGATTTTPEARPRARPRYVEVRVRDGRPVGGPERIRTRRGEVVRIAVTADAPDRVHVHGYDLYEDVGPGRDGRLRFPARLEGVFELELHDSDAIVARLEVSP